MYFDFQKELFSTLLLKEKLILKSNDGKYILF